MVRDTIGPIVVYDQPGLIVVAEKDGLSIEDTDCNNIVISWHQLKGLALTNGIWW